MGELAMAEESSAPAALGPLPASRPQRRSRTAKPPLFVPAAGLARVAGSALCRGLVCRHRSTFFYLLLPSSTFFYLLLPSSTFFYLQLPPSTFFYLLLVCLSTFCTFSHCNCPRHECCSAPSKEFSSSVNSPAVPQPGRHECPTAGERLAEDG